MLKISILDMSLKMTNLKLQLNLPGANEICINLVCFADSNNNHVRVVLSNTSAWPTIAS